MQQNNRKPAIRRGVKVELENARVEVFGGITLTTTGKKFLNIAFFAPVDLDEANAGEVKYRATLWEEKAEAMLKAASKRYNVKGYIKVGKPWEKDGRKIVSNEFVVGTLEVASAATQQAATEEVNDSDIPF